MIAKKITFGNLSSALATNVCGGCKSRSGHTAPYRKTASCHNIFNRD